MTAAAAMSYPIKEILGQKKRKYLVDWEGVNPDTGLPWPQSWEPRANLNAGALSSWKEATRKKCRKLDTMCDNDGGSKRAGAVNAQPEEEAHGWSVLESAQTEASTRGSGSSSWHVPESAASSRVGDTTDGNSAVQGAAAGPVQALNMAENIPRERGTPSKLSGSTPALVAQKWGPTLSLQPPVAGVVNSQVVASAVPWHPFAQAYDNCSSSPHPPLAREIPGATPGNAVTTWIETPLQQIDNYTRTSPPERADSSLPIQQSISVSSSEAHAPNEARDQSSGKTTRSPEYLKPTRCAGLAQPTPEPPTTPGHGSTPTSPRDPSDGEGSTYSVVQLSVYGTSNVQKDESVVRRSLVIPTVPLDGISASQWACATLPPPASQVVEGSGDIDTFSEVGAAAVFPDLAGSGCVKTTPTSHVKLVNTPRSPKSPLIPTANPYSIPISLDEELDRFAAAFGVTPGVVIGQVALFQRRKDEGGWYEHPAL